MRTVKICKALFEQLDNILVPVTVHSSFQQAANLSSPYGLVSLLSPRKTLQPGAILLAQAIEFEALRNYRLEISTDGLFGNGICLISFEGAAIVDLQMENESLPPIQALQEIRDFLMPHMELGLVSLVFCKAENSFTEFLASRLASFRREVWNGEQGTAAYAARRVAGCGPGLTPSSDDFLCGYIAAIPKRLKEAGFADAIAEAASAATNDISAALLKWAGKNYFSEDILDLKVCLCEQRSAEAQREALQKVANFGSSSGYDFLTGFYFGLLDNYENGGI